MSFLDTLFGKRERSSDIARDRLLTVLVHDRVKLTPDMMEQLKTELSAVIARYVPCCAVSLSITSKPIFRSDERRRNSRASCAGCVLAYRVAHVGCALQIADVFDITGNASPCNRLYGSAVSALIPATYFLPTLPIVNTSAPVFIAVVCAMRTHDRGAGVCRGMAGNIGQRMGNE